MSKTIEIGIDLGTTNSAIATMQNGEVAIVKNTFGSETTPSVIAVNPAGNIEVGKPAFERLQKRGKDAKQEIKRLMGTNQKVSLKGKDFSPEEISAEILKSLRKDALQKSPEIFADAAVITIPAYFSTLQSEATKRAGELAGFKQVVLLQEPIAAAFAYGFGRLGAKETWLVYDLGGGTFDSALIINDDGELRVVSHAGDNFLGGKDIDRAIVEQIIAPHLGDIDFKRYENQLRAIAQNAKIQLSSLDETAIEVEFDDIYETINFTRSDLERVASEVVDKSISLCKEVIVNAGVAAIDKVIFVGGQTQAPFIRKAVSEALNVPADTSADPLTAVAVGACIYAKSLPINTPDKGQIKGAINISINYESLTRDADQLITGIIADIPAGAVLKIQRDDGGFETEASIKDGGKFIANLNLNENQLNTFYLYLITPSGDSLDISPNEIIITHGLGMSGVPIPRSIGVGVVSKDFITETQKEIYDIFFEKDSSLPLSLTKKYKTARALSAGDYENALPITIYEGEAINPKHNLFICEIAIRGDELGRSLPAGSEVELTISVDQSRSLTAWARVVALDKTLNARATVYDENLNIDTMQGLLDSLLKRLNDIGRIGASDEIISAKARSREIKNLLKTGDEDDLRKANARLKELQSLIANISQKYQAQLSSEAIYKVIDNIEDLIDGVDDEDKKSDFEGRLEKIQNDFDNGKNPALVLQLLDDLEGEAFSSSTGRWIELFECFSCKVFFDPRAEKHIDQGMAAVEKRDLYGIKSATNSLYRLLPQDDSTTTPPPNLAGLMR